MELKLNDPRWYEEANCATTDPEVMFPQKGMRAIAKKVCQKCLVPDDCLISSFIEGDLDSGFRGGLSPKERKLAYQALREASNE